MKKSKLLLITGLALLIGASSCKKNKDDEVNPNSEPSFSEQSVEENKADIQASAIAVVQDFNSLTETKGIAAAASFAELVEISSPLESNSNFAKAPVMKSIKMLAAIEEGTIPATAISKELKSLTETSVPKSFQEAIDKFEGKYSWNSTDQKWDFTAVNDELILEFPSKKGGTTNDAVISITATAVSHAWDFIPEKDRNNELPNDIISSCKYNVKIGSDEIMNFDMSASYKSNGLPESSEIKMTLETIEITSKMTNSDTKIASDFKFLNKDKNVLSYGVTAEGNFTAEKINSVADRLTNDVNWEDYESNEGFDQEAYDAAWEAESEGDIAAIGEVVTKTEVYMQLANVRIVGNINDVVGLTQTLEDIEDDEGEISDEELIGKVADAINNNVNLFVKYADGDKIAETEAYIYENVDTWEDHQYNEITGEYENVTMTDSYWDLNIRMVFADGSKMNMDTYMEKGFDDLIDEIQALGTKMENAMQAELDK